MNSRVNLTVDAPNAPPNSAARPPTPAAVSSADRLSFTVFIALAIHALLILGISFSADFSNSPAPTLEITLATHKAKTEPDKADYLAQHNQQASGIDDKARQMTTDQRADIDDSRIQEISPTPQVRASRIQEQQAVQVVTTTGQNAHKTAKQTIDKQPQDDQHEQGNAAQTTPLSAEIASLRAKLDKQRQAIAKRPRIRRVTSVATKASADAAYIGKWVDKIQFVGNRNFPKQALREGVFGSLRLATTLKTNGTIHSVEILKSSGHRVLDDAALQIVHLSSPFSPFPQEIRKDIDLLEIIRTWHFEIDGLSTSGTR